MNMLFIVAAVVMLTVAAAFLLIPLLRPREGGASRISAEQADIAIYEQRCAELERELEAGSVAQEEYDQTRAELDRQLLADTETAEKTPGVGADGSSRIGAAVAALLLPLIAVSLYVYVGGAPEPPASAAQFSPGDVEAMVRQLEQRLESEPDNGEGWLMLGRSYTVMGQPEKAVEALTRARRLLGDTPDVLVTYAQALASGSANEQESLAGMPAALLDQALAQAPNHPQALWLSGLAAAQAREPEKVLDRWSRLQAVLPEGSEDARMLAENLATLRQNMGMHSAERPAATAAGGEDADRPAPSVPDPSAGGITVTVRLDESLKQQVQPQQTLFVFARAPSGPPMPLAVSRHTVGELPLTITLDDGDAMMPGNTISKHDQVEIVARISTSGNAIASSGDLQAPARKLSTAGNPAIELVINTVLP